MQCNNNLSLFCPGPIGSLEYWSAQGVSGACQVKLLHAHLRCQQSPTAFCSKYNRPCSTDKANACMSYLSLLAGKQELAAHDRLAVSRQPQKAVQQHVVYWRQPRHAHKPAHKPMSEPFVIGLRHQHGLYISVCLSLSCQLYVGKRGVAITVSAMHRDSGSHSSSHPQKKRHNI